MDIGGFSSKSHYKIAAYQRLIYEFFLLNLFFLNGQSVVELRIIINHNAFEQYYNIKYI